MDEGATGPTALRARARRLAHGREGVRQDVVQRLARVETAAQHVRLALERLVAHRLILRRARLDLVDDGADLFEFLIVAGAEQARKKSHNCMIRLSKRPAAGRRCTRCDSAPGGAKRPGRARPALSRKGRAGRC